MTVPRLAPSLIALATAALLAACGAEGGRSDYADGDSGQAAPATVPDASTTRGAPDSTAGVSERTRSDAVAGDTAGAKGVSTDSASRTREKNTPPRAKRP